MSKLNFSDFTYISGKPSLKFLEECAKIATNKPRGDNLQTKLDYIIYDVLEYIDKNLDARFMVSSNGKYKEIDSISGSLAKQWFSKEWDRESKEPINQFLTTLEKNFNYWSNQKTPDEDIGFNGVWTVFTILDCCGATQDFAIQMYDKVSRQPLNDAFHEILSEAINAYNQKTLHKGAKK